MNRTGSEGMNDAIVREDGKMFAYLWVEPDFGHFILTGDQSKWRVMRQYAARPDCDAGLPEEILKDQLESEEEANTWLRLAQEEMGFEPE